MSWLTELESSFGNPTSFRSLFLRYGIALVLVSVALFISLLLHGVLPDAFLLLFLAAIVASGWFGSIGPGLFSVVVSVLAMNYYFIRPYRAFSVHAEEVPYVISFLVAGIIASWLSSARRVAEAKQKAHLDELFEQAPEAILLVDGKDRVLRVNREFSRIFGYEPDEAVGRFSMDLIVPREHREQALQSHQRLAHGESVNLETVRARKDASLVNVAEIAVPIVFGGERIAHYMIFRDITDSKRSAEALLKAKAELAHLSRVTTMGELVASIAHEVNQPIGAIVTNANAAQRWLGQNPPNPDEVQEALSRIVQDANRAGAVIGRIRALVTKTSTQMAPLDMNELIKSVLILTEHERKRGGVELRTELSVVPLVLGDRVQLQQVMLNLIMNGIDAMTILARRRELQVRLSRESEFVVVEVQDSGVGWDLKTGEHMFDAFYSTKPEGMGMGLTISYSIIEAHGGRLRASLASPHGAVFSFTLPVDGGPQDLTDKP
jgi:PAS domain S-box-containing protein